jgi:hypothetical protein
MRWTAFIAALAIWLAGIVMPALGASVQPPLVPLVTGFAYWDHDWIRWTPEDPIYESIEAQSIDGADGAPTIARIFLTERRGDKHQVFYLDDARLVAIWRLGEAHYSPITYEIGGKPGAARDLSIAFTDKDGRAIVWTMNFAAAAKLSPEGSGLRTTIEHAANLVYSLPVKEAGAAPTISDLTISGKTWPLGQTFPGAAAGGYADGTFTSRILLGPHDVTGDPSGAFSLGGRPFFTSTLGNGVVRYTWENVAARRAASIEIDTKADRTIAYRHKFGAHVWSFEFLDPLPPLDGLRVGANYRFEVSWDAQRTLVKGVIRTLAIPGGIKLLWTPTEPGWLTERPFSTELVRAPAGYIMTLARDVP